VPSAAQINATAAAQRALVVLFIVEQIR